MTQRTKKIPYGKQWLDAREERAVLQAMRSDFLTQGPKVPEFEQAFKKKVGAQYAVAVSNGTAALHLAALALGLQSGDEVLTTPMSFLATSNAILYTGAKPVFVDIDSETQCLDAGKIEEKITSRTRAIFVTDFAGHPADMKKIFSIARKHKLKVVEDAAHALGAVGDGYRVGSCHYADMTIFSFHPVKHITTGEGGMITTNDHVLFERLSMLRTHGVTRDPAKLLKKNEGSWYYEMQALGYNYRLTEIQASLGIEQLKKLQGFLLRRRKIAAMYRSAFAHEKNLLCTPIEKKNCRHAYHLYVIRLQRSLISKRRVIFEALQKEGLGVQVHYIPIPAQPYYKNLGYRPTDYPVTEAYYRSAISLPMFPKMTDREVLFVIRTVKKIIQQHH